MVFEFKRAAQGGLSWAFLMAIILFNNYSAALSPTWRAIAISMVPALLVGLQQNPYFVNPKSSVLMISSAVLFFYISILQFSTKVRESMKNPTDNRLISGISYASAAVLFGIAFIAASAASSGGYKNSGNY